MARRSSELGRRIRDLRRRHFGPRGKRAFAEKLGVPVEQLERYESGLIPEGPVLLRMCELTGEDLQWLLTGVASRGTVVISGARGRHQELLARIAEAIDRDPALARPIEALLDLLLAGRPARQARETAALPAAEAWIPVLQPDELPERLDADGRGVAPRLPAPGGEPQGSGDEWRLAEPQLDYAADAWGRVQVVEGRDAGGRSRRFVRSPLIAQVLDSAFGVAWTGDAMVPMFRDGDVLIVWPHAPARVGRPAVLRTREPAAARCGIWLGDERGRVHLGRLSGHAHETLDRRDVCWALDVLYRVVPAG